MAKRRKQRRTPGTGYITKTARGAHKAHFPKAAGGYHVKTFAERPDAERWLDGLAQAQADRYDVAGGRQALRTWAPPPDEYKGGAQRPRADAAVRADAAGRGAHVSGGRRDERRPGRDPGRGGGATGRAARPAHADAGPRGAGAMARRGAACGQGPADGGRRRGGDRPRDPRAAAMAGKRAERMSKGRRIPPDSRGMVTFYVTSGYGGNTRQPYVEVAVGEQSTQMSPEAAQALALNLLQAAEAAQADGLLVTFAQQHLGLDLQQAAQLLRAFRAQRDDRRGDEVTTV